MRQSPDGGERHPNSAVAPPAIGRRGLIRNTALWLGSAAVGLGRSSAAPAADVAPQQTILIIRHGDKPVSDGNIGIDANGKPDVQSLTTRGWQRAGVWAELFAPSLGQPPALPVPKTILTCVPPTDAESAGGVGTRSHRPLYTVAALAGKLNIQIDLRFQEGQEAELAAAVAQTAGVSLICWVHEDILAIVNALAPNAQGVPSDWPDDRYNVVFRFDRSAAEAPWVFQQIIPVMLPGDPATPL